MKPADMLFAKKSFGQHFLIDKNILQKIVESCNLNSEDTVIEIGPGKGALTALIAPLVKKVIAIEKDRRFIEPLQNQLPNIDVVQADILKFDFDQIPPNSKLIGNLPYNIASPIIEKILNNRHLFSDAFIMIQLEHGQRMIAAVNEEDYSSFSCFVQYYATPKILFNISGKSFSPAPKVTSCFMHLSFTNEVKVKAVDEVLLFNLIRHGFNQRRKTIENSLEKLIPKVMLREICQKYGLNEKSRAENISLEEYVKIANEITNQKP